MKFLTKATILVIGVSWVVACSNETESHETSASRVVGVLSLNELVAETRSKLKARLSRDGKVSSQGMTELHSLLDATVTWQAAEQPLADLYASHFSAQELKGIAQFFESTTGKKYLSKKNAIDVGTRQIMLDGLREHELQFLEIFSLIRKNSK